MQIKLEFGGGERKRTASPPSQWFRNWYHPSMHHLLTEKPADDGSIVTVGLDVNLAIAWREE